MAGFWQGRRDGVIEAGEFILFFSFSSLLFSWTSVLIDWLISWFSVS
jgi:hypothetical protein